VISALGGSVAALMLNPPDLPTVGASGAIMGLLSAAFVLSFHPEAYDQRWRLRSIVAFLAVPALIPTASAPGASTLVDFSGHFGGAAAGVFMGFVLQAIWPEHAARPLHSAFAAKVGIAGFVAAALAFAGVAMDYPTYAARANLMMSDVETPKTTAEGAARSAQLILQFPHDPRTHLYRAAYFANLEDWRDAELEIRTAMADPQAAAMGLSPMFKLQMQFDLAMVLEAQGRDDEAKAAAQPLCAAPVSADLSDARSTLHNAGLCDDAD
jgi:rhomboid protease GluP